MPRVIAILKDLGLSHLLRLSEEIGGGESSHGSRLISTLPFPSEGISGENSEDASRADQIFQSLTRASTSGDVLQVGAPTTDAGVIDVSGRHDGVTVVEDDVGNAEGDALLASPTSPDGRDTADQARLAATSSTSAAAPDRAATDEGTASSTRDEERSRDWASILSPGEQQRLGIARVLYHRPALVFLDESSGAVAEATEARVYRLMSAAGVTVVAVGHRSSLRRLHDRELSLSGPPGGQWKLSDLQERGGGGGET